MTGSDSALTSHSQKMMDTKILWSQSLYAKGHFILKTVTNWLQKNWSHDNFPPLSNTCTLHMHTYSIISTPGSTATHSISTSNPNTAWQTSARTHTHTHTHTNSSKKNRKKVESYFKRFRISSKACAFLCAFLSSVCLELVARTGRYISCASRQ